MPSSTFRNLPADKRQHIVAALLDEFCAYPLSEAKISRIVVKAAIPRGSFYVYFSDMFDAYRTVLAEALTEVDAGLDTEIARHPDDTLAAVYDYTKRFIAKLSHSPYRDLYTMHWLINRAYLAAHDEHIYHRNRHTDAASLDVMVDDIALASGAERDAVSRTVMDESHATLSAVLNGEEPTAALRRFEALIDILRAGVRHTRQIRHDSAEPDLPNQYDRSTEPDQSNQGGDHVSRHR